MDYCEKCSKNVSEMIDITIKILSTNNDRSASLFDEKPPKLLRQIKTKQFKFILRNSFSCFCKLFQTHNRYKFMKSKRAFMDHERISFSSLSNFFEFLIKIDFSTWWLLLIPHPSCSWTITNNSCVIEIHGKSSASPFIAFFF